MPAEHAVRVEEIKKLYGFDKPAPERFLHMLARYARFDLGRSFVVHLCKLQVAGVVVEIRQVVVGFNVTRIVLKREREAVERAGELATLEIEDAEVTIGLSDVITFGNSFLIMLGGVCIATLV